MFVAHLALIFSVQFGLTALLFFLKKQSRQGNILLGITMSILAFQHFMHYMWATKKVYFYPWLLNIDLPLDGCMAPLLYFYICAMTGEELKFSWKKLLHFWPIPVGLAWYIYFNLQPAQFQIDFIDTAYNEVPAVASITNIMLAIYLGFGYRKLDRYIKAQTETDWVSGYNNVLWLRQFVAILFFINVAATPLNFIARFEYLFIGLPAVTGFVILFVVYKTFNHPEVMSSEIIRRFTQQLEYQREIEKVRRQISNDIHDELGAGLTQISMLSTIGKIEHKEDSKLSDRFNQLIHVSNYLMGSLREVVWAINPVHDNLNSLQAFLRQYISTFFEPTDIRIQMDFVESSAKVELAPYLRRNLILVVKEACNNIVKHSAATEANFSCSVNGQQLVLIIKDNGKGAAETNPLLGNGVKNIQKRVAEVRGKVEVWTTPGKGFEISITCPLTNIA